MKMPRISVPSAAPADASRDVMTATIPGRISQSTGSSQARLGARDPRLTVEVDPSGRRVVDPGDDVEEGGLARPVRADQADDGLLGDGEVDAVDRDQAAEPLGDLLGLQDVAHPGPPDSPKISSVPGASPIAPTTAASSPIPSLNSSAMCSSRRRR